MREVVVLAGGQPPSAATLARWGQRLPTPHAVVAADGGLALAAPLDLRVDLVVGDLDSVAPGDLAAARRAGARVETHPVAKDATDVALALDAALAAGAERLTVLGGGGGRADHELALWLLLASPAYAAVPVRAWSPRATTDVVHPDRTTVLDGTPGELCSLLAVHGPAHGVRTTGLRFGLDGETLAPGSSRGVSNQLDGSRATVAIDRGVLLAVRPGLAGPPAEVTEIVP